MHHVSSGIGTYLEEMLLHHGIFDDSPHTRADIWAFARLRMLRITADLKVRRAFLCFLVGLNERVAFALKNDGRLPRQARDDLL